MNTLPVGGEHMLVWDAATVGLVGLAIALAGVVATLVAPRLGPRLRLYHDVVSTSRLGSERSAGVSVRAFYGEKALEGSVSICQITFSNIGNRDITRNEFLSPINIEAKGDHVPISVEAKAPDGVEVGVLIAEGSVKLTWTILKPGEDFILDVVFHGNAVDSEIDISDVEIQARLKDVKVGQPPIRWRDYATPILAVAMSSVLFFGMNFLSASVADVRVFSYQLDGVRYYLRTGGDEMASFKRCKFDDTRNCTPISRSEAKIAFDTGVFMKRNSNPELIDIVMTRVVPGFMTLMSLALFPLAYWEQRSRRRRKQDRPARASA